MVIDLHVIAPSGTDELERLLDAAARAGLDGVCLVGSADAPPIAAARACAAAGRLALFFGVEFPLERGRLLWIPADLAVLEADAWRARPHATADQVAALAVELGGALIAVHPYDRTSGPCFADGIFQVPGLNAVQVANAPQAETRNHLAVEAMQRMKLSAVGGTGPSGVVGRAATTLVRQVSTQAELVDTVLKGDLWGLEFLAEVPEPEPEDRDGDYRPRHDDRGRERHGDRGGRPGPRGPRPGGDRGGRPGGDRGPGGGPRGPGPQGGGPREGGDRDGPHRGGRRRHRGGRGGGGGGERREGPAPAQDGGESQNG